MKQFSQPTKILQPVMFLRPTKLLTSLALSAFILTGCGDESSTKQPSKEQIQYLSHIDQAEFYQRQGQLKASILEARNAMELKQAKIEPFMIVGQNLLIAGDGRSAQKQFQSILDSDAPEIKTNSEVKQETSILLARALFVQKKTNKALTILDSITTTSSELKVKKLILLSEIALEQEQFKKADSFLNEALSEDKKSIIALINLSKSAHSQNDLANSSKYIANAEQISPNEPQLWLWKAQVAQHNKQWADSEEFYIKALEDIGSYDIMTFDKYKTISDLIIVLRAQGKAAEAYVYEEVLAKSSPGTIKSTYISAVKNFQNGEFKKAEAELESILDQSPGHVQSGILLGITKFYLGKFEDAEKLLTTYLKEGGSTEASKVLAATKLKLKKPAAAKELLKNLDTNNDPQLLALFGIASLTSGDTDTGLEYINKSLALKPNNTELRLKLATFYTQTGNPEKAISQLSEIDRNSPDIHKANLKLVAIYTKNGSPEKAKKLISTWKAAHPKKAEPIIAEAGIATYNKQSEKAETLLKKAIKTDPSSVSALLTLAKLQITLEKSQNALSTYETALKLQPTNRLAIGQYLKLSRNSADRAISFITALIDENPDQKILKLANAELYAREGDIDKALKITNKLIDEIDNAEQLQFAIEGVYSLGVQSATKNKKADKALLIAKEARQKLPGSLKAGLLLANVQLIQGKSEDANITLRELKSEHTDSSTPYEFEGDYFTSIKDFSRAADAYTLAKSKKSDDRINLKLYKALSADKKSIQASEHLRSWITESPKNPKPLALLALHYQTENQKEKAISFYEQLISILPNDPVSLNNLAWLYFETNNTKAESTAKKALSLQPNSAAIADTYGWILYKNNKIKESTEILKKAYKLSPKTQEIALHLAEVYEAQGNDLEAEKIRSEFN